MRALRAYLLLSAAGALACCAWLIAAAAEDSSGSGSWSGNRIAALLLGGGVGIATPIALLRLARQHGADSPPFHATFRYWRWVFIAKFCAFLAVLFGSRWEGEYRLAWHLFAVMLIHRAMLCFPSFVARLARAARERRILRAADAVLSNIVVVLVITELALRGLVAVQGGAGWVPGDPDPLGAKLREPCFGWAPNSLGYNDREFERGKPAGRFRVAAIGDSFFVGHVPRPYGVIARTEAISRALEPERDLEVYNFGIVATSPVEYLEILRRDALGFEPDLVLVGFYVGNDVKEVATYAPPTNKRWYVLWNAIEHVRKRLAERAAVAEHGVTDLTRITRQEPEFWLSPDLVPAFQSDAHYIETAARHLDALGPRLDHRHAVQWKTCLAHLDEMKRACDGAGVPMLLVIEPDHVQVSDSIRERIRSRLGVDPAAYDLTYPQRRVSDFCDERGIPAFDLLPAFLAAAALEDPDRFYLKNDNHWSARGNEVAAQALAEWLVGRIP